MTWSSSDRRERLPDDWAKMRAKVKARAKGKCEATTHAKRCSGYGSEADHIDAGDNHSMDNLQWLSFPCHLSKTAREAAARNRERKAARIRPTEQHPGRVT